MARQTSACLGMLGDRQRPLLEVCEPGEAGAAELASGEPPQDLAATETGSELG